MKMDDIRHPAKSKLKKEGKTKMPQVSTGQSEQSASQCMGVGGMGAQHD
jgi:hypothetical protein